MTNESGNMFMPVVPQGYGYGGGGDGMFGGGWMWFLLVWMAMFGWGNGGFGGNGNVNNEVQRGFDQATLTNGISGIRTDLCNGFAGVSNSFAQAEIANNARQLTDMQQNFAIQQGLGNLQYAVATEACADRNAVSMALQQVLTQSNNNTQRLLDQMCSDKIDAKNELIANLRQQLAAAQSMASQNAQTAAIIANNEAQTAALEQYLAPVPRPAYVVNNPQCCNQNYGCGCGNN